MRHYPMLLLAVLLAGGCASQGATVGPQPTWQSFEAAVARSGLSEKPILVEVYAPWCGWCKRLEREVFTDPAVRQYMTEHFELARLNGDDDEQGHRYGRTVLTGSALAQRLGASGYPTTLFLAPGGARVIAIVPGYLNRRKYLQVLQYIADGTTGERALNELAGGQ